MENASHSWQGQYQQLPSTDLLAPQPLIRRDSGKVDRKDNSMPLRGERRSRSAQQQRAAALPARNIKLPAMLPAQKPVQLRQKDKLVLLPRYCCAGQPTITAYNSTRLLAAEFNHAICY